MYQELLNEIEDARTQEATSDVRLEALGALVGRIRAADVSPSQQEALLARIGIYSAGLMQHSDS